MDTISLAVAMMVSDRFDGEMNRGHTNISVPHPSLNPRNGIQTLELLLEDYHEIARLVTARLQEKGHEVTVIYDETDGIRAFVLEQG